MIATSSLKVLNEKRKLNPIQILFILFILSLKFKFILLSTACCQAAGHYGVLYTVLPFWIAKYSLKGGRFLLNLL